MPGSHADDIVGDYFESEDWAALDEADSDPEPDSQTLFPPSAGAPPS